MNFNHRNRIMPSDAEARWAAEWEEYVEIMERLAKLPADVVAGFKLTLSQIRTLPAAKLCPGIEWG